MKYILDQLFDHQKLTQKQAREVLVNIALNRYNPAQIAAFISVYLMRNISVDELSGFRDALLELCTPLDLENIPAIDMCGTGGDGKNTFNISTIASFIVAGAGYKVAKHGNYGVSSVCGSSNVLEKFGFTFTNNPDRLKKQLEKAGICFLHAPLFHPALKTVGPIRKELGVKTFFNMLGPLVNPAQPPFQSVGVYSLKLGRLYQFLHQNTNKKYAIQHSMDGYDEISLTGQVKLITNQDEKLVGPEYFGLGQYPAESLFGGETVDAAATIFGQILNNEGTMAQTHVVLANAALAIQCFDQSRDISDCIEEANISLKSGSAKNAFLQLLTLN